MAKKSSKRKSSGRMAKRSGGWGLGSVGWGIAGLVGGSLLTWMAFTNLRFQVVDQINRKQRELDQLQMQLEAAQGRRRRTL